MRFGVTAVCAAFTALLVASAAASPRAGRTYTYTDPVGDAFATQAGQPVRDRIPPDITQVTVTDDGAGTYTFGVLIPSRPSASSGFAELSLNIDKNYGTGAPNSGGSEFFLFADRNGGRLEDVAHRDMTPPTFRYSWSNGPTWTVRAGDVGGTTAFFFSVAVLEPDTSVSPAIFAGDFAPNNTHGFVFPQAQPKPKPKPKPKPVKCKPTQKRVVVNGKAKCVPKKKR